MVALADLCDLYFIVLEGEGWESMRMLTQFNDLIGSLAAAEDPRAEYAEFLATILPESTSYRAREPENDPAQSYPQAGTVTDR